MTISFIGSSGCSAAAINGNSATATFATAPSAGDLLFALGVIGSTRTAGGQVYNNAGTLYTLLSTDENSTSGLAQGGLWYRIATSTDTTVTCSGTGASSDATAIVAYVFRNQGTSQISSNVIRYALTTGSGTTPDGPAITSKYNGDAIIAAAFSAGNTAAAVTAPTSNGSSATTFSNLISTGASDNRLCQCALAWFASSGSSLSYNPNAWASFASTTWVAYTIVIQSTDGYTPFDLKTGSDVYQQSAIWGPIDVIGY